MGKSVSQNRVSHERAASEQSPGRAHCHVRLSLIPWSRSVARALNGGLIKGCKYIWVTLMGKIIENVKFRFVVWKSIARSIIRIFWGLYKGDYEGVYV